MKQRYSLNAAMVIRLLIMATHKWDQKKFSFSGLLVWLISTQQLTQSQYHNYSAYILGSLVAFNLKCFQLQQEAVCQVHIR